MGKDGRAGLQFEKSGLEVIVPGRFSAKYGLRQSLYDKPSTLYSERVCKVAKYPGRPGLYILVQTGSFKFDLPSVGYPRILVFVSCGRVCPPFSGYNHYELGEYMQSQIFLGRISPRGSGRTFHLPLHHSTGTSRSFFGSESLYVTILV